MLDERGGTAALRAVFTAAGCQIASNVPFEIAGRTIALDGWDAVRKVGFEFITTAAGDREEITPEVVAALDAANARGEIFVFLIDELEALDEAALGRAATRFLQTLRERGAL